ncbi:MAG: hypothetical protein HC817_02885 [Saprospiraceae bacterium]|nr:hypothetical protein [Saprospiraceae bacterium]
MFVPFMDKILLYNPLFIKFTHDFSSKNYPLSISSFFSDKKAVSQINLTDRFLSLYFF